MNNNVEGVKIKLKYYLKNPGYFSILVLGDSGTGKSFLIKEELKDENKKGKLGFFYPFELGETEAEIAVIFKKDFIVIKNIEELSENQQNILTKALSTEDGSIGLEKNRGLKRILFTSSFDVLHLTSGPDALMNRFWDRISQLVLSVPSFRDMPSSAYENFRLVWRKMDFDDLSEMPDDADLILWLKANCANFSGNFRDLDKIAILWHQYRLMKYANVKLKKQSRIEAEIFRSVRRDFEEIAHFPTQRGDSSNTFEFEKGKSWESIERSFRSKFKLWAKKSYGTIKKAELELNMPKRKMDKW